MSLNLFKTVKDAIAHLNPNDIRAEADRPLRVGLFANSETAYRQMEAYFCPAMLSPSRRQQVCQVIERAAFAPGKLRTAHDIEIYSPELSFARRLQFQSPESRNNRPGDPQSAPRSRH
jgi:hypothetical protein